MSQSQFAVALAFLTDPTRVRFYTNAERAALPCPVCGARPGEKCKDYKVKLSKSHPERVNLTAPRSQDEQDALIEKLANKYARGWKSQASSWHSEPARYPR